MSSDGTMKYSLRVVGTAFDFVRTCLDDDIPTKEKIERLIVCESKMELLSALKSDNLIIKCAAEYYIKMVS